MSWGGPGFVLAIIAIVTFGKVLKTWIRAKHGYALGEDEENPAAAGGSLDAHRKAELVGQENERLKGQMSRLEARIAVLERIATDTPSRLSREIDALR